MNIVSLGVGEAFDEHFPNNSHLISSQKTNILLDCGYSVPVQWWKLGKDADFLDAIYISHKHADHFFGLPMLLMRMWEEGRVKPLTIICQEEVREFLMQFTDIAYRMFSEKFKYERNFVGVSEGRQLTTGDLKLSFAPTVHSIENLAISITVDGQKICYSGDGQFIEATEKLYEGSDLVIQETYFYDKKVLGHACIKDAIEMAERVNVKTLMLTHMQRNFRKNELPQLMGKVKSNSVKVLIPKPFDECAV